MKLENNTSGLMPMPTKDEIRLENLSLHADLALGYDDAQRITILNSWEEALVTMDISTCLLKIS